jgi:predicted amidohydrolase
VTHIRLLQVDSSESESPSARVDRVLSSLEIHAKSTEFLVLPELWHIGAFNLAGVESNTYVSEDSLFADLARIAGAAGIWLHAGSFAISHGNGKASNTALLFGPSGHEVARYRKQHLFGFADGERTVIDASDDVVVVDTPLGQTGLTICYDLRFPEQYRALVDKGAETFLTCSGWPTPRIGHWDVLNQARAIENQSFVVACNGRGTHAGVTLGGQSMVVSPRGEIIARANADAEFIDAVIQPAEVSQWRDAFPVLKDRTS